MRKFFYSISLFISIAFFSSQETQGDDINNPEIYSSKNETGKITFFPNNIPHYTDIQNSDNERITIAFDLAIHKPNTGNWIKLI